jgi:hypothetical protein
MLSCTEVQVVTRGVHRVRPLITFWSASKMGSFVRNNLGSYSDGASQVLRTES